MCVCFPCLYSKDKHKPTIRISEHVPFANLQTANAIWISDFILPVCVCTCTADFPSECLLLRYRSPIFENLGCLSPVRSKLNILEILGGKDYGNKMRIVYSTFL